MTKFYIAGSGTHAWDSLEDQLRQFGDEIVYWVDEAEEIVIMPGNAFEATMRQMAASRGLPVSEAHSEQLAGERLWRLMYDGGDSETDAYGLPELDGPTTGAVWGGALDVEGLHKEAPSAITTFSRKRVDPLNMRVEDFDIGDIAHALARQVRYNGHVGKFLSVARHSLWVSHRLKPHGPLLELWGLLHDAGEAYIGDMVKPIKHDPSMHRFREVEDAIDKVLAEAFGLPFPMPEEVHDADRFVTVEVEIGLRFKDTHESSVSDDEDEFLARFYELTDTLEAEGL